jgi:hypothetical protein
VRSHVRLRGRQPRQSLRQAQNRRPQPTISIADESSQSATSHLVEIGIGFEQVRVKVLGARCSTNNSEDLSKSHRYCCLSNVLPQGRGYLNECSARGSRTKVA